MELERVLLYFALRADLHLKSNFVNSETSALGYAGAVWTLVNFALPGRQDGVCVSNMKPGRRSFEGNDHPRSGPDRGPSLAFIGIYGPTQPMGERYHIYQGSLCILGLWVVLTTQVFTPCCSRWAAPGCCVRACAPRLQQSRPCSSCTARWRATCRRRIGWPASSACTGNSPAPQRF